MVGAYLAALLRSGVRGTCEAFERAPDDGTIANAYTALLADHVHHEEAARHYLRIRGDLPEEVRGRFDWFLRVVRPWLTEARTVGLRDHILRELTTLVLRDLPPHSTEAELAELTRDFTHRRIDHDIRSVREASMIAPSEPEIAPRLLDCLLGDYDPEPAVALYACVTEETRLQIRALAKSRLKDSTVEEALPLRARLRLVGEEIPYPRHRPTGQDIMITVLFFASLVSVLVWIH